MMKRAWGVFIILLIQLVSCTDDPEALLTVATDQVENISQTHASAGGTLKSSDVGSALDVGLVWSTDPSPDISLSTTISAITGGTLTNPFGALMTGLTPNTTYYVRAYVTGSAGTSYGNQLSFTTLADVVPGVETDPATNILYNSASIKGVVFSSGTADVTERGIVYGLSEHPTITGSKKEDGTGTGAFTTVLNDLTENTKYFARAYAINIGGTSYGNEISFSTPSSLTVTTTDPSKITYNSATLNGTVTSVGPSPVTERGIVYGLSEHPTTDGNKVANGSGVGTFTTILNGLAENTKYVVRAYAVNAYGTVYGNEVSFTSRVKALPTSYLGYWYNLNGTGKFIIENDEIIFADTYISYIYDETSISLVDDVYKVSGRRIGWPNPVTFSLKQGADTNGLTIGSTISSQQSVWRVVGRTVGRVTYGTGSASLAFNGTFSTWEETNDAGEKLSWVLTETGRDNWAVYISRDDGARLKIDLTTKSIFFSPTAQDVMTKLYVLTGWFNE